MFAKRSSAKSELSGRTIDNGTETDESVAGSGPANVASVIALSICWAAHEADRIGHVLPVPRSQPEKFRMFGRGEPVPEDDYPRLQLAIDRGGEIHDAGPLLAPKVSRRQLLLQADDARRINARNVGRCKMFHNGSEASEAIVMPGDTLQLGNQLLFLCVVRTLSPDPTPPGYESHTFGAPDPDGIVGESAAVWELRRQIAFVAAREGHVLISGASGTGKELVAQAIHRRSPRGVQKLVARNAATFPEALIDAELFGNMSNYPNPGMRERIGMVGAADGSSLFLDEFAELPLELQSHLLRLLDAGEYHRLGEVTSRRSNFRLIAATNRPERVKEDVAARFPFKIALPDLNARREDVPLLSRHLLEKAARTHGAPAPRASSSPATPVIGLDTMEKLVRRQYSTHVRELESLILNVQAGRPIDSTAPPARSPAPGKRDDSPAQERATAYIDPQSITRVALEAALAEHAGVLERVWRALGLRSRYALHRLMRKHGIRPPRE
jgi:DNA-binding NtrC family response regulator